MVGWLTECLGVSWVLAYKSGLKLIFMRIVRREMTWRNSGHGNMVLAKYAMALERAGSSFIIYILVEGCKALFTE